ncbi:hypothetical protein GCM10023321_48210 [Pseudonocardia eucalypti]|uniref:Uncharacterized protein n=1 Tax=Pseudonocardia eucalypti TaxID=648755 RepID=A0ABP9QIH4_9PSEU|nr:acetyl-CoA carboxylase alpha subunit [Pseudonocardia eucalypti]
MCGSGPRGRRWRPNDRARLRPAGRNDGTLDRARETATNQGIRATDLARLGVAHRVIAELPDAAAEPKAFARRLVKAIAYELADMDEKVNEPCV